MHRILFFISLLLTLTSSLLAQSYKYPPGYYPSKEPMIFTHVEQNPQFPGGDTALIRFLQKNIKYPKKELKDSIVGKVLIRFVVSEIGEVEDVHVIRGVSPGLDAEALRVVKLLPPFTPGRQQGKPVRVYFNLPIVFKLQ